MDGYIQVREQERIRFAGKQIRRQQRTGRQWQKELWNSREGSHIAQMRPNHVSVRGVCLYADVISEGMCCRCG